MRVLTLKPEYHQSEPRARPPVDNRVRSMDTLDRNMKTLLESEEEPVDKRMKLHDQSLVRYMNVHDNYKPIPTQTVPKDPVPATLPDDPLKEEVLSSVPKSMKNKADLLWRKMKNSSEIDWNEKGELKYKGQTMKGTNVVDLVNDVLRKRKHFEPRGWQVFTEALKDANVPQELIGHEDRRQYMYRQKDPKATPMAYNDEEEEESTFQTPVSSLKRISPSSTPRIPRTRALMKWNTYK